MFADAAELRSAILRESPSDFVSSYLLEPVPAYFDGNLELWIRWKSQMAMLLEVDPKDIVLAGSAAIGYSLNPNKNFRRFGDHSDFDVCVVSPHHFDVAWRHLRKQSPQWLSLDGKTRYAIEIHRRNYVFSGTIATNSMLGVLPFGKSWLSAISQMSGVEPTVGRDIKLRIYKDYEALRHYHARNLSRIQTSLLDSENEEEQAIELET